MVGQAHKNTNACGSVVSWDILQEAHRKPTLILVSHPSLQPREEVFLPHNWNTLTADDKSVWIKRLKQRLFRARAFFDQMGMLVMPDPVWDPVCYAWTLLWQLSVFHGEIAPLLEKITQVKLPEFTIPDEYAQFVRGRSVLTPTMGFAPPRPPGVTRKGFWHKARQQQDEEQSELDIQEVPSCKKPTEAEQKEEGADDLGTERHTKDGTVASENVDEKFEGMVDEDAEGEEEQAEDENEDEEFYPAEGQDEDEEWAKDDSVREAGIEDEDEAQDEAEVEAGNVDEDVDEDVDGEEKDEEDPQEGRRDTEESDEDGDKGQHSGEDTTNSKATSKVPAGRGRAAHGRGRGGGGRARQPTHTRQGRKYSLRSKA